MVRTYWGKLHRRAFSETARTLRLDNKVTITFVVVVVALACLYIWGSPDASRDELIARLGLAAAVVLLFPIIYTWKLISLPARIQQEANEELAQQVAKLQAELQAANDQVAHSLSISAGVESTHADDGYGLEWHLLVENTASVPIEYQQISIEVSLDGSAPVQRLTRGKVLGRTAAATYKFPFNGKYEPREGELLIDVAVDFGLPGKAASRRLIQKLRVPFRPRGAITFCDCFNIAHQEQAL